MDLCDLSTKQLVDELKKRGGENEMKKRGIVLQACVLTVIVFFLTSFLMDKFPHKDIYEDTVLHCLIFLNMIEVLKN